MQCGIMFRMSRIKVCLLAVLSGVGLMGQGGPIPGNFRSSLELLPNAATNVSDPHNVSVVRTSGTVLTIGNGASATLPQTVRAVGPSSGNYFTRQFTSALTLTSAAGGLTGTIYVYAVPVTTGGSVTPTSMQVVVISNLGGTLNCSGSYTCTVVSRGSTLATQARGSGVYLAAATMTAGSPATFDVSGVTIQTQNVNTWARGLLVANVTGSAVTLTAVDGRGVAVGQAWSIPANTTTALNFSEPGYEVFFERGLTLTAGTASALNVAVFRVLPQLTYSPAVPQ
jgi:hypothetical protein